ncbi:MAG: hypothetical protein ACYTGP_07000 [Planctomycetota bacterium]|jgi:hypothetical protein
MRAINQRFGRIGVLAGAIGMWLLAFVLLMCIGDAEETGWGGATRTTFGISGWMEVTSPRVEPLFIVELLVPGKGYQPEIHAGRATTAFIALAAISVFLFMFTRRSLGNISPRNQCGYCGYVVSDGSPLTNICPECGKLPNLHRDPWAVWR